MGAVAAEAAVNLAVNLGLGARARNVDDHLVVPLAVGSSLVAVGRQVVHRTVLVRDQRELKTLNGHLLPLPRATVDFTSFIW